MVHDFELETVLDLEVASDFDAFDGSGDLDDVVKIVVGISLAIDYIGVHLPNYF